MLDTGTVFSSYIETVLFILHSFQVEEVGEMRWDVSRFSQRKG